MEVNFLEVLVVVKRKFEEYIVKFKHDPGLIKISLGEINLIFRPNYISFRFPGEHVVNGKRYEGEILINCDEIHPDPVNQ